MDHCKDSENVIMHSILCVKLEPFTKDEDCTQKLDPLQPDSDVLTKVELLQDFKTEIESNGRNQAMNELIRCDILKNDPGDTKTKIEEIYIKTEYIGDEASALDNVMDSRGNIEDDTNVHSQQKAESSSKHTEHGSVEIQKQTGKTNTTTDELSHSCEPHRSDVIIANSTNDGSLNVTSPANLSTARSDTCSSGVDVPRIHNHSTSEEGGSKQSSSLFSHLLPHPSYVSDVCDMEFRNSRNLLENKVVHTHQKPHVCDICKNGFSKSYHLLRHKRIHTGQSPYVCDICKKGFSDSSDLVKHKRIHTGEKPYVCDICKKGFSQSANLVRHKRIHTGQKPYACDICQKKFSDSSHLVKHKRFHTGQTPYVCDVCKMGFSNSFNLSLHKLIHTGYKPHV